MTPALLHARADGNGGRFNSGLHAVPNGVLDECEQRETGNESRRGTIIDVDADLQAAAKTKPFHLQIPLDERTFLGERDQVAVFLDGTAHED